MKKIKLNLQTQEAKRQKAIRDRHFVKRAHSSFRTKMLKLGSNFDTINSNRLRYCFILEAVVANDLLSR